jgi:hypothetical protein
MYLHDLIYVAASKPDVAEAPAEIRLPAIPGLMISPGIVPQYRPSSVTSRSA